MTWDDIYERATGTVCGDPKLRAKDEARYEVKHLIMDLCCHDIEEDECPEDSIEDCCDQLDIQFDEFGTIVSLTLPDYLKLIEIKYR